MTWKLILQILLMIFLSTDLIATTIPTAPINIGAYDFTDSSARLSFKDMADDEEGYRVYHNGTLISTVGAKEESDTYHYITLTGLTPTTLYTVQIVAFNSAGESSPLVKSFRTIEAQAPSSPNTPIQPGVHVSVWSITTDTARISFRDNSDNENGFRVEDTDGNVLLNNIPAKSSTGDYQYAELSGLNSGTLYRIKVFAYNDNGDSISSAIRTFRTQNSNLPTLTRRDAHAHANCLGYVEKSGVDSNNNGVLDDNEITSSSPYYEEGTPLSRSQLETMIADGDDVTGVNSCEIEDMSHLFENNLLFNQDIGDWNVGSVTNMSAMFDGAIAFDQDIGDWDVSNVTDMRKMFDNITLSTTNYDSLLNGWSLLTLQHNIVFSGGNSKYSIDAAGARQDIIDTYSWSITDGGKEGLIPPAVSPFKIKIKTDYEGKTTDTQFEIPTIDRGYNYNVDCDSDGILEATAVTGNYTCNYSRVGEYIVTISGDFPQIYFSNYSSENESDSKKLLSIEQWGNNPWRSMYRAFMGCKNMINTPIADKPNLTNVTTLKRMFMDSSFNQNIGDWNVSTITDMARMFMSNSVFNQEMANWDVSSVEDMLGMFAHAKKFNQDIGAWDVSSVTNMPGIFYDADAFNQNIGDWNVSAVEDMNYMFYDATIFNQDISNWDVQNVTNMNGMFRQASTFNQNIANWNVSSVTNMSYMFDMASSFSDKDLSGWDVSNITNHTEFSRGWGAGNIEPIW